MSLLDEYYTRRENPPDDVAKRILFDVVDDIIGRRGFDWDEIIDDPEIKEDLLRTNLEKIRRYL
jgi:hypothetical protein